MGCGNPNNEDNSLFPLKQTQEAALTGKESEAALTGKESEAALTGKESEAALTGKESETAITGKESEAKLTGEESEAKLTGEESEAELTGKGSEALDSSQIFHVDNTPAFTSFPFASLPNSHLGNVHGIHQLYTRDPRIFNNIPGLVRHGSPQYVHSLRGNLSNQYTRPSGVNHPPSNMNFVLNPFTVSGDYYRNAHVVEGQVSDVNQSQITGSSPYSGCNPPLTQSTRGTFSNNDASVGASYPGNIDGSFLTLGAGGYILGGSSSFQRNPAGLPGAISSHTIQSSHVPEVSEQYDSFERNDRNLGIRSVLHGTYQGNSPYNHHYQGDPASAFLSFSNANSSNFHPGFGPAPNRTSESAKVMGSIFQTNPGQPPNYHVRNVRDATSAAGSNPINVTGVPVIQDHLGRWIPAVQGSMTQAIGGGYPRSAQPTGRLFSASGVNSATPRRSIPINGNPLPQTAEATTTVPGIVGSFPRRLGAQPGGVRRSVYRARDPRLMGTQTRSGVNQSQHFQITRNLHESAAGTGYPQGTLPHQLVQAQLLSSGPDPVITQAHQLSRRSNNAISQPSHKRAAIDPSIVASLAQRRKLLHDSMAARLHHPQRQGITATIQPHIPSEAHILRQQGTDELHVKPLGHQCFLCRRDLLFTPEGPISQPSMPPVAAVLPCGHTFHDHCLQKITSEEQAKFPACFACIEENERTDVEIQENK